LYEDWTRPQQTLCAEIGFFVKPLDFYLEKRQTSCYRELVNLKSGVSVIENRKK